MDAQNPLNERLYTSVDNGRLYMAYGDKYLGDVSSYNYSLTRFFSRLFGKSMKVEMNGKQRTVNTKSYHKWLNTLGVQDKEQPFAALAEEVKAKLSGNIRNHLSEDKKTALFRKLAKALVDPNVSDDKILKLIGKGALLNHFFQLVNGSQISFQRDVSDTFGKRQAYEIDVIKGTPLFFALLKKRSPAVLQLMVASGAKTGDIAHQYRYKQEIVSIGGPYGFSNDPYYVYQVKRTTEPLFNYQVQLNEGNLAVNKKPSIEPIHSQLIEYHI